MWPEVLVRNDGEMGEIYGNLMFFRKIICICLSGLFTLRHGLLAPLATMTKHAFP
jgi:hypothetical protein